jgi:hypothetical protein
MSTPLVRFRRLRVVSALVLASSLALSGCSGKDDDSGTSTSASQDTEGGATLGATSPLTGLDLSEVPEHPIVTVKIDNSGNSAPQVGLADADLVTEELVEGGITRLAVSYYASIPREVGPVRSMRATDIGVVKPLEATLVASGGAPVTVRRVKAAGIDTVTEGGPGYYRRADRPAPYNLFNRLPELVKTLDGADPVPAYLPFGDDALPKGVAARGLTASFSGGSSSAWQFRDGKYLNTDSNAASGDQFKPDTVLVLRVKVGDAGYLDPAGNPVPETKFTGTGPAMVFHDGRLVRGRWSKDGLDADITLENAQGALQLPPGKVWIELVPINGGNVTVTR